MQGFKHEGAVFRHGLVASVAALAAVWAASTGATQGPAMVDLPAADTASRLPAEPRQARWSGEAVAQLAQAIAGARGEGLDPADYDDAGLRRAAASGVGAALDAVADAAAARLAHDYYFGRVTTRDDMGWMIRRPAGEEARLAEGLRQAIASGAIAAFYTALLPADPRYRALRAAFADSGDPVQRDRLRVNMERWRWLPRALGDSYLYVNVPGYQLEVIDGGLASGRYDVVVGAKRTPTPMLASPTASLVVNPWWNVPSSIVRSSNLRPGRPGFVFKASADGSYAVRQPPGPRNALGRIKFNLDNDQAIYLHDTNARGAFDRDERALSHGCIRVKDIDQLAAQLMNSDGAGAARLDDALAGDDTATLRLPRTWQVYIVYFTIDGDDPAGLKNYADPYGYDAALLARLGGAAPAPDRAKVQLAAR